MERTIAGVVAVGTRIVETFKQASQSAEVFQTPENLLVSRGMLFQLHRTPSADLPTWQLFGLGILMQLLSCQSRGNY